MKSLAEPLRPVRRWLGDVLDCPEADVSLAPLGASGDSNLMYIVTAGGHEAVLRVPPQVKNDRSAHDVLREYRLLKALAQTDVPHAAPIAACEDPNLLGAPFFLMAKAPGFSASAPLPAPWNEPSSQRRELGLEAARVLATLAAVPWREVGLDGFGRPDGFLARQVPRWLAQLSRYSSRELDSLEEIAAWLEHNQPPEAPPGIVHGDFHLLNVMFEPQPPARVSAIVDWEMATIGDPMLDLGMLIGTWAESGEEPLIPTAATHEPGMATRAELGEAYAAAGGRPLDHLDYYATLALFKLACILEGSYSRYLAGQSQHAGHARYGELVPRLLDRAAAIFTGELSLV